MGHMGRAWARLLSYFNKERPIGRLSEEKKVEQRQIASRPASVHSQDFDSDEDPAEALEDLRRNSR